MSDRIIFRRPQPGFLNSSGTSAPIQSIQHPVYEGLVVDVIVDHMHPEYSLKDGYNVGSIKIRILDVDQTLANELLSWAYPFDTTIYEMPLIGELVILHKIRGSFFYTRKIPIAHRVQENGMLKLNDALEKKSSKTLSNAVLTKDELTIEKHKFGDYYKPDSRVRPLKHFEGDTIIQSRMGSTVRFGSSQMDPLSKGMAPNIILRTGQGKDIEKTDVTRDSIFGLIMEDINKDASSIWMTSDQNIPYEPITNNAGSRYRSIANPPQVFDKASIIINSDKIALNSKKTHIMLFSNEEIYLNSYKRTSIDTDESIYLTALLDIQQKASRNIDFVADADYSVKAGSDISLLAVEKLSIAAKKIHIGGIQNDVEPMVGGTSLSMFLARLLHALMGLGVTPPQFPAYQMAGSPVPLTIVPPLVPGPAAFVHGLAMGTIPVVLSPIVQAGLLQLYTELVLPNPGSSKPLPYSGAPFNSYDAFVALANEDTTAAVVKNEFEKGEQIVIENNKWELTDNSYYKVV